jgi:hypothetical protein
MEGMMENLAHLNWAAVIVAALVGYFPGALWYSPMGFVKPWARELGVDLSVKPKGVGAKVAIGIIPALVAATVFAIIAGPHPSLHHSLVLGAEVAIGFVASSFAIQYLYEQRSPGFWLINSGYHLLQFLLIGAVLALWP